MSIEEQLREMVRDEVRRVLAEQPAPPAPPPDKQPSGYLDTKQVAALLNLAVVTVEQMRARGDGPPFLRSGKRRIIYDPAAVENWLRNRR